MDIEVPEAFGVAHEFGKSNGGLRVIDIPLLPESCHRKVIFDGERDQFPAFRGDAEALQQRKGEPHAGLGVALDALGFADVRGGAS